MPWFLSSLPGTSDPNAAAVSPKGAAPADAHSHCDRRLRRGEKVGNTVEMKYVH
jgi:hypothetical protein